MKRPRPRQPVLGLVGLFAIFLLMPGLSWAEPVDAFSIRNIDGEMFDSSAGKGPIIVSFFFPACAPCKEEIQVLHLLFLPDCISNITGRITQHFFTAAATVTIGTMAGTAEGIVKTFRRARWWCHRGQVIGQDLDVRC